LLLAVVTGLFPDAFVRLTVSSLDRCGCCLGGFAFRCPHFKVSLDSHICSIENSDMTSLLDLHPDTDPDAVSSGVADLHAVIDRLHTMRSSRASAQLAEVDRAIRRLESFKLKLVAAADSAGVAKDAGFTGADAWLAKTTIVSLADAARQVALASELDSGHDATAEALDAGLVSPEHAAVIVRATGQLPDNVSAEQRQGVETELVAKATRFSPDQLRRLARRAIEAVEPDQRAVDEHENELIRAEEQVARDRCSLSLHDNGDGTTTGNFTIPALAAAMLGKIIDAMTAPRRMRAEGTDRSFDWRHRRGLAFAELLEHLPTDHLHTKTAATVVVTIDHTVLAGAIRPPTSTPTSTSPPAKPGGWHATPGSCLRCLGRSRWPWTSAGRAGCSPSPRGWPKASNTPPAPQAAANAPMPGANFTTDDPGRKAAPPTSPTPSPSALSTTTGSTTPGITTGPCPTAASDSADERERIRASNDPREVRSWRR